jgi:hypothetical protein
MSLLKKILKIPSPFDNDIQKIIDLRNKLAHNSRFSSGHYEKTIYKNKNIFSVEGLQLFLEDSNKVQSFLVGYQCNICKRTAK